MINRNSGARVCTGAVQAEYDFHFIEIAERCAGWNGEVQRFANRQRAFIDSPGVGGFDHHRSERLRGLPRLGGIDQDEFQRNCVGKTVGIADRDLNSAAALEIDEVSKVVMSLDGQRTAIGRADIDCIRTGLGLARSLGRANVRRFEEPVHAIERNDQRIRTAAGREFGFQIERSRGNQFVVEVLLGPEDDASVSLAGSFRGIIQNVRGIPRMRSFLAS